MHSAARLLLAACAAVLVAATPYEPVKPGQPIRFPVDRGAHPGHRIEWWYATGHLDSAAGPLGFQVTFFRWRHRDAEDNPSRFAPRQLLFAHAALADPRNARLLHDQRSARALAPLVEAREGETDVRLDDWSLRREGNAYRAVVDAEGFALELSLATTQAPLLQGERGYSRKGPRPEQASLYYSEPQLRVTGRVRSGRTWIEVTGVAWLDHEWSSELVAAEAVGWDWLGVNLDDGGALMAFRMRGAGDATIWSAATLRARANADGVFIPAQAVRFTPSRTWTSPHTGTAYPVAMEVRVGNDTWRVEPLFDDQELDARASTGVVYWEGAVRVTRGDGRAGRGYLELTGYARRVPF